MARNVNGFQRANLHSIRERVERLQAIADSFQKEIGSLVSHLDYLDKQSEREDALLSEMNNAVRAEESTFSLEVADMVDCEDTDHMN